MFVHCSHYLNNFWVSIFSGCHQCGPFIIFCCVYTGSSIQYHLVEMYTIGLLATTITIEETRSDFKSRFQHNVGHLYDLWVPIAGTQCQCCWAIFVCCVNTSVMSQQHLSQSKRRLFYESQNTEKPVGYILVPKACTVFETAVYLKCYLDDSWLSVYGSLCQCRPAIAICCIHTGARA